MLRKITSQWRKQVKQGLEDRGIFTVQCVKDVKVGFKGGSFKDGFINVSGFFISKMKTLFGMNIIKTEIHGAYHIAAQFFG